ncbi:MAG: L,D-transpeptidase family protein [Ignavibacteriaceae bacterium]
MRNQVLYLLGLISAIFISNAYAINPDSISTGITPTAISTQMILILTKNWEDSTGILFRYERNKLGEKWKEIGNAFPVSIGRNGLAWGTGLHGSILDEGPVKHEGDGKSPAGVFRLSKIFGYESSDNIKWLNMPYIQVDSCVECVDDTNSIYYNTIIDDRTIKEKDWKSSEIMKLSDNEYEWGIFVENNSMPRIKGNGSCIFLHIWENDDIPTAGCSAMKEENLIKILHWLNINSSPVLVQLPQEEYNKLKFRWALP